MVDQKPPRLTGDERATVLALLGYQRASLVRKLEGVDDEAAARRQVRSDTTLLWLANHMAHAERLWVLVRFAGRDAACLGHPKTTIAAAVVDYRAAWLEVDAAIACADLGTPCRAADVTLRWVLMHLLEETARHAGHADILRELIDGTTGR